ncbi:MAG: hypothetical protein ACR2RE_26000, partial [Geminicoccaceae bacterium]
CAPVPCAPAILPSAQMTAFDQVSSQVRHIRILFDLIRIGLYAAIVISSVYVIAGFSSAGAPHGIRERFERCLTDTI